MPRSRAAPLPLLFLLIGGMLWLPGTARAASASATKGFRGFASAWRAGEPGGVVHAMERAGTACFSLHAYPLAGKPHTLKPPQAKAALEKYFAKLAGIRLKDATPPRTPANVRLYEYTYRPDGKDARTTYLQVRLKQDRARRWVLASVTESVKPRD